MSSNFEVTNSASPNFNFSNLIVSAHQKLIGIELFSVFIVSLIASSLRFEQSVIRTLTTYPGSPKVFLYPLIWYYFLYRSRSWDISVIYFSNEFYIRVIKAGWNSLIAFAAISFLIKYPISRIWVIINALMITLVLIISRYVIRFIYFRNFQQEGELRYLYIGSDERLQSTLSDFEATYGFTPLVFNLKPPITNDFDNWLAKYEILIRDKQVYGVIIGVGEIQDTALLRKLVDSNRNQIIDFLLSTRIGAITSRFEKLDSPNLVRIQETQIVADGAILKRIFDIFFALLALIVFTPFFIVVALLIKVTSSGPILYIEKRVGRDGKLFNFPKFRSMVKNANTQRLEVLGRPDENMLNRYKNDPRITPIGRFIRRWSIDELPQFWCVLIGTMSVVGPRPVLQQELTQINNMYEVRFIAKPGLTGLWQVTGRKEIPWNDRMVRDISYIDNWSLSKDLVLIWKTIGAVITGQGAH